MCWLARLFRYAEAGRGIFPMQWLNFATAGQSNRHIPMKMQ
jgi:hypothetical protein